MSETTPPMLTALRALMDARLAEVHTGMPGVVESYNPTTMRASIQPSLPREYTLRGERQVEKLPVINEVPILWPSFMGGVRLKGLLIPGDPVWLMFSQRSVDRWKALGGQVSDTEDGRMHHVTDAFAYPGGMPSASDGDPQIEFTAAGEIHAGGDQSLALNAKLESLREAIAEALDGDAAVAAVAALNGGLPFTGTSVLKGG